MLLTRTLLFSLPAFFYALSSIAQVTEAPLVSNLKLMDTVKPVINWAIPSEKKPINTKSFVIPTVMLLYGFGAIENDVLLDVNAELKDEMYAENPHKKFSYDNYLQFTPAAAVYALNALGIKGKHNLRDRSMIYLLSNIILNTSVVSIKKFSKQLRPDGSAYSSFPSGHTAEAFASAEFFRQEYKDVSPLYGIAGYAMAAATGYLRIYNNKHWFSDVVAGAGVGIVSTKLAYWLYPKIQHALFKNKLTNTMVMPSYQNNSFNVGLVHKF